MQALHAVGSLLPPQEHQTLLHALVPYVLQLSQWETNRQCSAVAGVTVVQPLSEARDKHSTYSSFFQPKPTEGFVRVPRGLGPAPAPFTATTTYE